MLKAILSVDAHTHSKYCQFKIASLASMQSLGMLISTGNQHCRWDFFFNVSLQKLKHNGRQLSTFHLCLDLQEVGCLEIKIEPPRPTCSIFILLQTHIKPLFLYFFTHKRETAYLFPPTAAISRWRWEKFYYSKRNSCLLCEIKDPISDPESAFLFWREGKREREGHDGIAITLHTHLDWLGAFILTTQQLPWIGWPGLVWAHHI